MKKIWYARDKVDDILPCQISEKEPEPIGAGDQYTSLNHGEIYSTKEFKALFGFTPRPGEKGQLEIKRIKLSKQSGKEPGEGGE